MTKDTKDIIKMQKASWAYLAGALDMWTIIMIEEPEMIPTIIDDMRETARAIKKVSGVTVDINI